MEDHFFAKKWLKMERETGFAPATYSLATNYSTAELLPLIVCAAAQNRTEMKRFSVVRRDQLGYRGLFFCVDDAGFEPATLRV